MATTDAVAAATLLDALAATGVPFAALHREAEIARGDVVSDIDLAVGADPGRLVATLAPAARGAGLLPIVAWPYDTVALTTFWVDERVHGGVQLDLLHDRAGRGRYGVRTPPLLERATATERWPRLDPTDELIYLLRKRQVKGDAARFAALAAEARSLDPVELRRRVAEILHPRAARHLLADLEAGRIEEGPGRVRRRTLVGRPDQLARYARRLRRPVGFWAHLPAADTAVAEAVARRFGAVLVAAAAVRLDGGAAALAAWARRIVPLRLRPALAVSVGSLPPLLHPDATVAGDAPDDLCAGIARAMAARLGGGG